MVGHDETSPTGSGFTGTTVAAASGANITVSGVSIQDDSHIQATLTPTNSQAGGGNQGITVSANGHRSSTNFFGQLPTSVSVQGTPVIIADGTSGGCVAPQNFGIEIDIKYQVLDQQSPAQSIQSSNMTPFETDTTQGNTASGDVCQGSPVADCTLKTQADGTWHDAPVGICLNNPQSDIQVKQVISMIVGSTQYEVRTNNYVEAGTSNGRGSITNNVDIKVSR